MEYITTATLESRFSEAEMTALGESGITLDDIITDANALADSYVSAAYSLPMASVPAALVGPVCDIARFLAYKDSPPEVVRTRYEDALSFLRAVAKREVSLGLVDDPDTADVDESETSATFSAQTRLFTRDTLAGF